MSKSKVAAAKPKQPRARSLAKGLIAGCIGGLVGVVAKTFAERMLPPQLEGGQELTTPATEQALVPAEKTAVADGIRWGFGAAAGAVYGAVVEFYPAATAKDGASFGVALQALSSKVALPALSLSAEPGEPAGEVTSYVVYGVSTEFVRKWVRKVL